LLRQYAQETRSDYCAGCSAICEAAVGSTIPIGRVMRCLMYSRNYDDRDYAANEFYSIPQDIRNRIADQDYTVAEKKCPRNIPIGRLMREALDEFG
jgi:predicted aldo/keto reductase-like oxidoreductase